MIEAPRDSSLAMNSRTIAAGDLSSVQSHKLFEFSLGDEVVATYHSLKDQKIFAKISVRGTYSKRKLIIIGAELRSTASGKYTPGESHRVIGMIFSVFFLLASFFASFSVHAEG